MANTKRVDPRNKRVRPPKGEGRFTHPAQILLDPEQWETVKEIATGRGITASEWTRRAIDAGIVKHNSRKKAAK